MSNPYGMTDDELLACLGPSWDEMSEEARDNYPHFTDEEPAPMLEEPIPVDVVVIPLEERAQAARDRRDRLARRTV